MEIPHFRRFGTETRQQFYVVNAKPCDTTLAAHLEPFTQYLIERRYSTPSLNSYQVSASHFAHWLKRNRLTVSQIDEALVARFVKHQLPQCHCAGLARRTRKDVRAALGHLLIVLRANGVIAEPILPNTPDDQELQRFDEYMSHVHGLALKTRSLYLHIVHHLLRQQFAHRPVIIASCLYRRCRCCSHSMNLARRCRVDQAQRIKHSGSTRRIKAHCS